MEKTILNFHFDYLNPSLTIKGKNIIFTFPHYEQGDFLFCNEKRPFDYMRYEVLSSLWGQCWFYTIYVSNNVAKAFKETYKLPNACNPKFRPNFVSAEICKILRPTLIYFVIFFFDLHLVTYFRALQRGIFCEVLVVLFRLNISSYNCRLAVVLYYGWTLRQSRVHQS